MKFSLLSIVFVLLGHIGFASQPLSQTQAAKGPVFKKVVWVVFENASYQSVWRQTEFSKMAQYGALLTNMKAETHPSLGNYIAMIAGSAMGIHSDAAVNLNGTHIGDLLEKQGLRWRVYAEAYPGNCYLGDGTRGFARKHTPFLSFKNVTSDPRRCQNIESSQRFDQDFANGNLPEYAMYVPDLKNDGHDTNVAYAGKFLASKFGSILSHPESLKDTLFVITYDEDEGTSRNQIYTLLVGANVIPGAKSSQALNHIALLKMIEDQFNVGNLGRDDVKAPAVTGIWK